MHRFEGRLMEMTDSNVWGRFIDVPMDIAHEILTREHLRLIAKFNDILEKHCSLLSHGNGTYFIMLNKAEAKKVGTDIGGKVAVVLLEDKTKYGMPMPEEMEELLLQDPEADRYFHGLTPGKQRSLLYIIGKPKGSETRLRKAITVCEYLKSTDGKLDFKELNQAMKDSRFRL